ncbi:MAG: 5-(carboxyamino)imidazole ribonucleotide synthase [Methylococcaceae bacterium]|nr:MAG: 5-(carboxyamino)imidazole ribonucleotide synthase [Methylococcaceae bacterium]
MKIGILGGGQLARMMALAGIPLGMEFIFLEPAAEACAAGLGEHLHGDYNDPTLLAELVKRADVVTYEFENVPAATAEFLTSHTLVFPPAEALAVAQDRWIEKNFLNHLAIPTPAYAAVNSLAELTQVMPSFGYPAILKSRTQGYDGKGQSVLHTEHDLANAWQILKGVPAIVEAFIPFEREVSIIAARNRSHEIVFYPLSENHHRKGILRTAQCLPNDSLQAQAEELVSRLLNALDYVGVLALEFFVVNNQLMANEFAPRVHNSGHWSIEGAQISQFENHLRAITDLPLGSTAPVGFSAMINFIGALPDIKQVLTIPNAHLHSYNKKPRKGRKIAHACLRTFTADALQDGIEKLRALADITDKS